MAKKKYGKGKSSSRREKNKKKLYAILTVSISLVILGVALVCLLSMRNIFSFNKKIKYLETEILTEELRTELDVLSEQKKENVVFISVCDTKERAQVFTGTGKTLDEAWKEAKGEAKKQIKKKKIMPVWVKADVVYNSKEISDTTLKEEVKSSRQEFYRWGLSFDNQYNTALLEAELNGAKIYEYENGGIDFEYLNTYLRKAGRAQIEKLPKNYIKFMCYGWICEEDGTVYRLNSDGLEYGRRDVECIDADYVENILSTATKFLLEQVNEDGSFVYGMYPRFDNNLPGYNILRHCSTIWSLICRYRMQPSAELKATIESTFTYLLTQVRFYDSNTAYLYEASADEIKLGGNGMMIIAMTEYMDVFKNEKYKDICEKLGNGILTMLDMETGKYYHVLRGDYKRKEEYRTVYYDGEATFALCRLYSLTKNSRWLDAAEIAVDHFIDAKYEQYKDHWVAYSMNEITKHVDKPEYYEFALRNVQSNLQEIYNRDTTYHTYLELLMVSFELYDRMKEKNMSLEGVDIEMFLKTIYARANRMLDGYFYPEYAMYMRNPQRILNTFMVRHDGFRVRIDDVQHNIGGYYLYYKNYEKLVEYGMLECIN